MRTEPLVPTKIVFSDASIVVVDDPHEVVTKLKGGAVEFQLADERAGAAHLLNPALILYLEKVGDGDGAAPAAG
jgi:hypothetical protein